MQVVLKDVAQENADKGKAYSAKLNAKAVERGKLTEEKSEELLARIHPTDDYADLAGCDLVIEAVFEDPSLKHQVFAEAAKHVERRRAAVLQHLDAADHRARHGRRPSPAGLHRACTSSRPVDKMPLVEIIRGEETSDVALAKAYDVVQQIRKTPIVVNDSRGFYTSPGHRLHGQRGARDAGRGRAPGLAGAGGDPGRLPGRHPAALRRAQHGADGQDRQGHAGRRRARRLRLRGAPRLGRGDEDDRARSSLAAQGRRLLRLRRRRASRQGLWPGLAEAFPPSEEQIPLRDVKDRMLFAEALETAKCFDEGVITSAAAANIGSIMGIGFPPNTGGAAQFMTGYQDPDDTDAPHRAGRVLRPRRRAGRRLRRAVPALGVPARPGGEGRVLPGLTRSIVRSADAGVLGEDGPHDPEPPGGRGAQPPRPLRRRRGRRRCRPRGARRPGDRAARPQRRRQVDHDAGPGRAGPADRRRAPPSPASTSAPNRSRSSAPPATAPTWAGW